MLNDMWNCIDMICVPIQIDLPSSRPQASILPVLSPRTITPLTLNTLTTASYNAQTSLHFLAPSPSPINLSPLSFMSLLRVQSLVHCFNHLLTHNLKLPYYITILLPLNSLRKKINCLPYTYLYLRRVHRRKKKTHRTIINVQWFSILLAILICYPSLHLFLFSTMTDGTNMSTLSHIYSWTELKSDYSLQKQLFRHHSTNHPV